jgi:urease gamma subunit
MPNRRLIAPVVVAAAVAGGGLAGAVLGVPGLATAQESTTTESQQDDGEDFRELRRGPGIGLGAAADALGMEVDELHEALHNGQTIAEVAADQGVEVNTVIDAMVDAIVEETGRDAGDVREHVTTIVNEGRPEKPAFGPGGARHFHRHFGGPGLDAAAEALGIERDELVDELRDGKTIADVAEEQGVDVDTVIDAMVDEARDRITEFVNEGPQRPDVEEDVEESSADIDPTAA